MLHSGVPQLSEWELKTPHEKVFLQKHQVALFVRFFAPSLKLRGGVPLSPAQVWGLQ